MNESDNLASIKPHTWDDAQRFLRDLEDGVPPETFLRTLDQQELDDLIRTLGATFRAATKEWWVRFIKDNKGG